MRIESLNEESGKVEICVLKNTCEILLKKRRREHLVLLYIDDIISFFFSFLEYLKYQRNTYSHTRNTFIVLLYVK